MNNINKENKKQRYITYKNDDIKVFWNPKLCQHAGKCFQGNREVFNPNQKPWINLSKASATEIAAIIDMCPSKALQYELKDSISVLFEENSHRSSAYKDGNLIGECEFDVCDNKWNIVHTGVRPAFEGQGIARRLLNKVVEQARLKKIKIVPICSYAKKVMEGKKEYKDVL